MANVLDVRSGTTIKQLREMAGRAMLDGPHDYATDDLVGPLLDLAVATVERLPAVIHKVDNAMAPFFECCVLDATGRLHYQYMPSRSWTQGGPLIEGSCIELIPTYDESSSARPCGDWAATVHGPQLYFANGPTPLVAAMRALVRSKVGASVRM